ncbi:HEXXH motif domain-containing protein [Virgisporangium aurantiacum]|uniref:HEXXH motif domain-containing protein n=1 Tax=Virgisporangium aurantiacum TaxID=175570 RepID=A0A8J3Z7S4_9ACTN|nr:HEXXH motif domain-containing protein [Virgisporangium aurantiacum]GIJ58949.1 HEXXH motif domain-containing protein [Virgisporangium aurantiacum]
MPPDNAADSRTDSGPHARHTLTQHAFDELAAGKGGRRTVAALWDSELSRRLILLRGLYDLLDDQPDGPLLPPMHAWHALERAQEGAPAAVTEILLSPSVGAWLSFVFREHARDHASRGVVGHLNVVALACAASAGQSFATRIPLRDGRAYVPLRGLVHFGAAEPWAVADAKTEDGRITIAFRGEELAIPDDGTDTDAWYSLRRISTGDAAAGTLTVWLDDLDPLRDLADPIPPSRLNDEEVLHWQQLLALAWEVLTTHHGDVAGAMIGGFTTLVPLPMGPSGETRSASSGDAFGSIMCSPPPDPVTFAVSLVHEFAHIRLGGLMHLLRLTEGDESSILYAPWRDDPRPLGGLMQGVYAFFAIADFWRRHRVVAKSDKSAESADAALAEFEYAYARAQAADGLATVQASGGLTSNGVAFTDRLAEELGSWAGDAVEPAIARLAQLVSDAHRAGWRIRHCTPPTDDVMKMVGLWDMRFTDSVHIGLSTVDSDPGMRQWSHGRLGLARRSILAPDQCHAATRETWAAELTDADFALFTGDALSARKGFADQIVEDPDRVDAWTGLGLALACEGQRGASLALLRRPEVVLAVYRRINAAAPRQVSPVDLTAWIAQVITP